MAFHFDIRLGIVLFLALTISGVSLSSYSYQQDYGYYQQIPYGYDQGTPLYGQQWVSNMVTVYPDQGLGSLLIILGIIVGIVTGMSFLLHRNR